jgi:hypothetical protein
MITLLSSNFRVHKCSFYCPFAPFTKPESNSSFIRKKLEHGKRIDASASAKKFVIPAGKSESNAMDGCLPSVLPLKLGSVATSM